jgi:hypothetical protein
MPHLLLDRYRDSIRFHVTSAQLYLEVLLQWSYPVGAGSQIFLSYTVFLMYPHKRKSIVVRFGLLGGQKIGLPLQIQVLRTSCINWSTDKRILTSLATHYQLTISKTCMLSTFNPFQSSRLGKFPQPGREGILNPCRAYKQTVLLKKLVQQGHEVKNISETFAIYSITPCTFLVLLMARLLSSVVSFPICIIQNICKKWTLDITSPKNFVLSHHWTSSLLCQVMGLGPYL